MKEAVRISRVVAVGLGGVEDWVVVGGVCG